MPGWADRGGADRGDYGMICKPIGAENLHCRYCGAGMCEGVWQQCPAPRDCDPNWFIAVHDRVPGQSYRAAQGRVAQGLGNYTEQLLTSIGITKELFIEAKQLFGLAPTCGCAKRREWLNRVGQHFGIGTLPNKELNHGQ